MTTSDSRPARDADDARSEDRESSGLSAGHNSLAKATAALPEKATQWAGSVWASMTATVVVATLLAVGTISHFAGWWQTVVYSLGALVSTLMLFMLHHTTHRQSNAVLVKLDELITATTGASEEVIDIEEQQPQQQEEVHHRLHHQGAPRQTGGSARRPPNGGEDDVVSLPTRRAGAELPRVTSLKALAELLDGSDPVFLRYSRGPEHDANAETSRDYEADVDMPGLSVCAVMPEAWWPRPAEEWIARRIRQYADLADEERFPWLLTGVQVGNGPDHEPLLVDTRPIAVLDRSILREAADLYRSRFRVGNDSSAHEAADRPA